MRRDVCVAAMGVFASLAGVALGVDAPVSWWKFDEASGSTASDSGTLGAPGTLSGAASFVSGISGNAVSIPGGALDFVSMGLILPGTGGNFSLQAWVKTTSTATSSTVVVGRHDTGYYNGYMLRTNADLAGYGVASKASFYQSNDPANTVQGDDTVTDGSWHHLVATYVAGGAVTLYVDGAVDGVLAATGILSNPAAFMVGGVTAAGTLVNAFDGLVDEVQYYDYELSASQVQFLHRNPGSAI